MSHKYSLSLMPSENIPPSNGVEREPIAFIVPPHLAEKEVFTTGEAAQIMMVSQQTVIRIFDNGELKGWRIPGSRFRRIPRDVLAKYIRDQMNGRMINPSVPDEAPRTATPQAIRELHLTSTPNADVLSCDNTLDLGAMLQQYNGSVRRIVVDRELAIAAGVDALRNQISLHCERLGTLMPDLVLSNGKNGSGAAEEHTD
jgi:excisionase family DNA binding protein